MKIKLIFSAVLLTSCGPIYSTNYTFTAPKSGSGQGCVQNCASYQELCKANMEASKESCEYDNQRLIDDCNERISREKNRGPKWTECGRQIACDFPESRCESDYRNCYRSCGGIVKEEQICVANCEKENPK